MVAYRKSCPKLIVSPEKCRYCCKSPKLRGDNFPAIDDPTDERRTYALARWFGLIIKDQAEQEMPVAAVGSAFRRLGSIGSPHLAQVPYVPLDIRVRATLI